MSDKSLLAKLLATENITVQKTNGIKTACFDLRKRILMLPIWQGISSDLEDLLIVHETGHALDTPDADTYTGAAAAMARRIYPGLKDYTKIEKRLRGFLNATEDARIDKRQKRRYPGSRKNYLVGYKELVDRNFFGTAGRDIDGMNLIDRLNIYFKGGNINFIISFTNEEKVLLRKVENAETWEEIVSVTEEIYLLMKQQKEDMKQSIQDHLDSDDSNSDEDEDEDGEFGEDVEDGEDGEDGEEGEGNDNDSNSVDDDDDGAGSNDEGGHEGENEKSSGEGAEKESESQDVKSGGDNQDTKSDEDETGDDDLVSETDENWRRRQEDIVKDEKNTYVYINFPKINYDTAVNDYKKVLEDWRNEMNGILPESEAGRVIWSHPLNAETYLECRNEMTEWRVKERDSISFMVKEFEQKKAAASYSRISVAKTGVINTNKLHTYKYNDDIFRRIATIPKGKNHGFVMFLDWSGSMSSNLRSTIKQLFSLTLFCKQIGVPFEVYAFKDCNVETDPFSYTGVDNVVRCGTVLLRNFLSSRMSAEEMNFAMSVLWYNAKYVGLRSDRMGGTPLNEALIVAPEIVNRFTKRNKLEITNVIWLTDGDANPGHGLENQTYPYRSAYYDFQNRYYFVDKETGRTYDYHPHSYPRVNTDTLLKILKYKTKSNLIGFFLFEGTFKRLTRYHDIHNHHPLKQAVARRFWNDNKFYAVKTSGYDDYYIIDSVSLSDVRNELDITNKKGEKQNVKQMVKSFSKFAQKKTVNRVLLRNFIELISASPRITN